MSERLTQEHTKLEAPCIWHPATTRMSNVYVLFQTELMMDKAVASEIHLLAYSLYRLYLNGEEVAEGPSRFAPDHPEYATFIVDMPAGRSVLSVIVHDYGTDTRILMGGIAPFLQCKIGGDQQAIALDWRCKELHAYAHINRRVNPQLGWMELCDTRLLPDLTQLGTEKDGFAPAHEIPHPLGQEVIVLPMTIRNCLQLPRECKQLSQGTYADRFGYVNDDPPVRYLSRDLQPTLPPDGVWYRYDFGSIGLYRPIITLDVPAGTVIEAAYSESLTEGRVYPFITLSAGASCHMDRWIAKGGKQQILPFSPRGFRYIELHIANPAESTESVLVSAVQRTYFDQAIGSFSCSDPLLEQIWQLGTDTLQANCEDALVDTPTRERGQWIGDAAVIGMEMLTVTYGDLSLIRRSLLQAAYRRRDDGLVAGLCPGQEAYLTSYALYWISGCYRYSRLTGDRCILTECYETADKTMQVFMDSMTPRGSVLENTWDFLDWGHMIPDGEVNVGLNLLLLKTLNDLKQWESELDRMDQVEVRESQIARLVSIVNDHYWSISGLPYKSVPLTGDFHSEGRQPGYHATVLATLGGHMTDEKQQLAVSMMKSHMQDCFPNNPDAPRLAHPEANQDRLITPSFGHLALQALWEAGEAEFVLDQYRRCWGWMLEQGVTTLLEVFDSRWSHCHAWSGCPTWQLSRYTLGLLPDITQGEDHYRLHFQPGSLSHASGVVPLLTPIGGLIEMEWNQVDEESWTYKLNTDRPISIQLDPRSHNMQTYSLYVDDRRVDDTIFKVDKQLEIQYSRMKGE
jgi:alpha-L-rhamnosidase